MRFSFLLGVWFFFTGVCLSFFRVWSLHSKKAAVCAFLSSSFHLLVAFSFSSFGSRIVGLISESCYATLGVGICVDLCFFARCQRWFIQCIFFFSLLTCISAIGYSSGKTTTVSATCTGSKLGTRRQVAGCPLVSVVCQRSQPLGSLDRPPSQTRHSQPIARH